MGGYRHERIAEMVHREVAQRLRTEIKDPRMVPLSITHVDVNRDLSRAIISFCPLGGGGVSAELRAGIDDVARGLRGRSAARFACGMRPSWSSLMTRTRIAR